MRKYLVLIAITLALATYEAAHACANHNKSKGELQTQFSGGRGAAGKNSGAGRFVASNKGAPTALDAKFFDKLNQTGDASGPFNSNVSDDTKSE